MKSSEKLRTDWVSADPGLALDRRVVAESEAGRMEWWLLPREDGVAEWVPLLVRDGIPVLQPKWMPLPGSQFTFLQCPVFEVLFEGGRGCAKTASLLMDYAKEVGKGYGSAWRGILFRQEYDDLSDVIKKIEEMFPAMFPGFRLNKSKADLMAVWPDGEALLLRNLKEEKDYDSHHGHEYPWIGYEELTQWEDDSLYLKMQSCCRAVKPGIPFRVRATTNSYGVGSQWVKRRFQLGDPTTRGRIIRVPGEMPRAAVHGELRENFILLHAQPSYRMIVLQSTKNPAEAKAWDTGDWNVTSGGMIDDLWDARAHVIPPFSSRLIPRGWTLTRSYDHGQSKPFSVGWWLESNGEPAEMPDGALVGRVRGDLILWAEWYGTNGSVNTGLRMAARDIARGIVDREADLGVRGRVLPGPADTEIFNASSDRMGRSPADDMEDAGVKWARADKSRGSRRRGWELIRTRLQGAFPGPDGTREEPGLFVCARCRHWIDLVPPMPRDRVNQDDVPEKYEDHAADMTRYRLNWKVPEAWGRGF